jgi:hypothetical protein
VRRAHDLRLVARFSLLQAGGQELPARHVGDRDARAADVVAQDQGAVCNDSHEDGGGEGIVVVGFALELGVGGVRRERGARTAQQHEKAGADQPG